MNLLKRLRESMTEAQWIKFKRLLYNEGICENWINFWLEVLPPMIPKEAILRISAVVNDSFPDLGHILMEKEAV